MSAPYPHTVTIWHKHMEGRVASWMRTVIRECRFQGSIGRSRMSTGDAAMDTVMLYVKGAPCEINEGDRFALGDVKSDSPVANARTVNYVETFYLTSDKVHHLEIGGM